MESNKKYKKYNVKLDPDKISMERLLSFSNSTYTISGDNLFDIIAMVIENYKRFDWVQNKSVESKEFQALVYMIALSAEEKGKIKGIMKG